MPNKEQELKNLLEENRAKLVNPAEEWPSDITRAVRFIHNHRFDPNLTVSRLKEECHLSGASFSGRFKYYVGQPPKQYWLEHRITIAKKLLKEESLLDISILRIALEIGFRYHSSFSIRFKKYEGCSPTEYRENYFEG